MAPSQTRLADVFGVGPHNSQHLKLGTVHVRILILDPFEKQEVLVPLACIPTPVNKGAHDLRVLWSPKVLFTHSQDGPGFHKHLCWAPPLERKTKGTH